MKKVLSFILAALMICAMTVPALASADPTPSGDSTTLTYRVTPSYIITIPTSISVSGGTGTGDYGVSAGTLIEGGKKLVFKISDASDYDNGFRLKNTGDETVFLGYTITKPNAADSENPIPVLKNEAFFEVLATEANAGETVSLTYKTAAATVAGNYSGTVTIAVSLESVAP